MSDAQVTVSRCATCGADLPAEGTQCPACTTPEVVADESCLLAETVEHAACDGVDPDCAPTSLWIRVGVALVYLTVGVACGYGSITFFDGNFTTSSDWVFGAMAIALAFVALLGVKESLFPSKWTPE